MTSRVKTAPLAGRRFPLREAGAATTARTPYTADARYDDSPFGVSITSAQATTLGVYVTANAAYCAITGYTLEQLCGMSFQRTCHPDDIFAVVESARELLAGTTTAVDTTTRLLRADGSTVCVRQHRSLVRDVRGKPLHIFTHTETIPERISPDAALIEAQGRFRSAFDNAPIGITIANADGSNEKRYIEVNPAFCTMTGYSSEQLLERSFLDITHKDDRTVNRDLWNSLLAGDIQTYQLEKRYVRADGEILWVLVNTSLSHDANGKPLHKITQIVDISDRKQFEAQLQHFAHYDSLTALYNRRHFERELEQQVKLGRRNGSTIAVALIDLDNFKYVNDTLGHAAGDELLCRIATILTARCRSTDVVARLGGDEFAVILRDIGAAQANRVANDIRTAICGDSMLDAMRSVHVSASIGVAFVAAGQYANAQDVMVAADVAMYDAKNAGRNRVSLTLSVNEPRTRMETRVTWVERIRDALLHNRFRLIAQPVVELASGVVNRYEIQLQMVGENGEVTPSAEFLPTADKFGLGPDVDKWVIRQTIAALRSSVAIDRHLRLSVSIAGTSITDTNMYGFIEAELLRGQPIQAGSLIFEMTGISSITTIDAARDVVDCLRKLGCVFSLDDFGAGLNSFSYLKLLRFDSVKIDASFITAVADSPSDRLMVKAMAEIVAGLGIDTVAECVADERTLAIVRDAGVTFAQGRYVRGLHDLSDLLSKAPAVSPN